MSAGNTRSSRLSVSVKLLIVTMLSISVNGCAVLSKQDKIDKIPTEAVIVKQDNVTYWCLGPEAFTAVIQCAEEACH